jgi:hypothetical protein
MGTIHGKVIERIEQIKKEVHTLQSPKNYALFKESFTSRPSRDVPEEILNDWVDRLTVRSFNEELKAVFPYIYSLVDESDIPVKEINADDLIGETRKSCTCDEDESECPIHNTYDKKDE